MFQGLAAIDINYRLLESRQSQIKAGFLGRKLPSCESNAQAGVVLRLVCVSQQTCMYGCVAGSWL